MLMHLPEAARAFRTEKGFVGVDLPFDGERYSLIVVTSTDKPKALKDFAPVKGWLSGAGFAAHKGDLALPKFSLETSTDLLPLVKDDLKDGLKSPTALAEFGSAATIQGILQRTKIDVFEEGAEAAAATAVVVGRALEVDDARAYGGRQALHLRAARSAERLHPSRRLCREGAEGEGRVTGSLSAFARSPDDQRLR